MAPNKPITYVLAGDDHNNAFSAELDNFDKRAKEKGDVVVLRAKEGQSLEDVIDQIKPPANIILAAHGSEKGTFTWNGNERYPSYNEFFALLPREGINAVTIESCYGGTALEMLANLPDGTLLQSQVGKKVPSHDTQFSAELTTSEEITPFTILMESLDNIDPAAFEQNVANTNKWIDLNPEEAARQGYTKETLDPNDVLPHTIGIGGHPPITLNLNEKISELANQAKEGTLDLSKFKQAEEIVKKHFDARAEINISTEAQENKIDAKIHAVAEKLRKGDASLSLEEKRFAYALTAANMETTGEMQRLQAQARGEDTVPVVEQEKPSPAQQVAATETAPEPAAASKPKPEPAPITKPTQELEAESEKPAPKTTIPDAPATTALESHTATAPEHATHHTSTTHHKPTHTKTHQPHSQPSAASHSSTPKNKSTRLNEAFGATKEEVKALQEAMGGNLGPYGEKDAQGNYKGNDGIAGKFTFTRYIEKQKELGIDPPKEKYDPEVAQQIQEHAAAQSKGQQQPGVHEPAPTNEPSKPEPAAPSTQTPTSESPKPEPTAPGTQAPSAPAVLSSWMNETSMMTPATPAPESWMAPEPNFTPASPEMQAMLQKQLAAARGESGVSHDNMEDQAPATAGQGQQADRGQSAAR